MLSNTCFCLVSSTRHLIILHLLNLSCCSLLAFNSGNNFSNSSLFFASRDLENRDGEGGRGDIRSKESQDLSSEGETVYPTLGGGGATHIGVRHIHNCITCYLSNTTLKTSSILMCCLGNQLLYHKVWFRECLQIYHCTIHK